jgi:hypothetical protein
MSQPADFPDMADDEVAVLTVEADTGIVLSVDGTRALGSSQRYRVFRSLDEAIEYSRLALRTHPRWECVILDREGKSLQVVRDENALRPRSQPAGSWLGRLIRRVGGRDKQ